jgi:hypothetical protein
MTKSDAVNLFGSVAKLAGALGITQQAIYQWDEDLTQQRADWVVGAALRSPEIDHRAVWRLLAAEAPNKREAAA